MARMHNNLEGFYRQTPLARIENDKPAVCSNALHNLILKPLSAGL